MWLSLYHSLRRVHQSGWNRSRLVAVVLYLDALCALVHRWGGGCFVCAEDDLPVFWPPTVRIVKTLVVRSRFRSILVDIMCCV